MGVAGKGIFDLSPGATNNIAKRWYNSCYDTQNKSGHSEPLFSSKLPRHKFSPKNGEKLGQHFFIVTTVFEI